MRSPSSPCSQPTRPLCERLIESHYHSSKGDSLLIPCVPEPLATLRPTWSSQKEWSNWIWNFYSEQPTKKPATIRPQELSKQFTVGANVRRELQLRFTIGPYDADAANQDVVQKESTLEAWAVPQDPCSQRSAEIPIRRSDQKAHIVLHFCLLSSRLTLGHVCDVTEVHEEMGFLTQGTRPKQTIGVLRKLGVARETGRDRRFLPMQRTAPLHCDLMIPLFPTKTVDRETPDPATTILGHSYRS